MVSGLTPPSKHDDEEKLNDNINSLRNSVRFSAPTTNVSNRMGSSVGGGGSQVVPSIRGLFAVDPSEKPESIEITYTEVTTTNQLKTGDEITTNVNGWKGKLIEITNTNVSNNKARFEALFENSSTISFSNVTQTFSKSGWSATYVINTQTDNALILTSSSPIVSTTITDNGRNGNPIIKQIYGTTNNGQILFIKPKDTKTLTLSTGGNIDITSNVTVNDNEFVILQYFKDVNANVGKYLLLSGGGGTNLIPLDNVWTGTNTFGGIQVNGSSTFTGSPVNFNSPVINLGDQNSDSVNVIGLMKMYSNLNMNEYILHWDTAGTYKIHGGSGAGGFDFTMPNVSGHGFDFIIDTGVKMGITNTSVELNVDLDMNLNPIRFQGITGVATPTGLEKRFLFSNSANLNNLSVKKPDGTIIDLESSASSWVGTATSDLNMNGNDIKEVDVIFFNANGTDDAYVQGVSSGLSYFSDINSVGSMHAFYTGGITNATHLRLIISDTVITPYKNIIPANLTVDLGSSSYPFQNLTLSNALNVTGATTIGGSVSIIGVTTVGYLNADDINIYSGGTISVNTDATNAGFYDAGHTANPTSAVEGAMYYNNSSNVYRFYNGTSWTDMSGSWVGLAITSLDMNDFDINGLDRLIFSSTGNVGDILSSADYGIEVDGGSTPLGLKYNVPTAKEHRFYVAGVEQVSLSSSALDINSTNINISSNQIILGASATSQIFYSGRMTSSMLPMTGSAYDLGSSTLLWNTLHIDDVLANTSVKSNDSTPISIGVINALGIKGSSGTFRPPYISSTTDYAGGVNTTLDGIFGNVDGCVGLHYYSTTATYRIYARFNGVWKKSLLA